MKVTMYGRDLDVLVMSRAEYELARLMKEPIPKDFGNFVMSPMPGTLISFAVKEGDVVVLVAFGSGFTWGSVILKW